MKEIKLVCGAIAIIDDEDFELVSKHRWHLNSGRYASCHIGNNKYLLMHRLILNLTNGKIEVDHINGNGLDNRRANLRLANKSKNQMNSCKRIGTSSKFKGVCWNKEFQKWRVRITTGSKRLLLGDFDCEIEAAEIYNTAAKKYFGEFAKLNEI